MLNKAERFRVVKEYKILCCLGLLPTEVDLTSWELRVPSKRKRSICSLSWILFILHVLYKSVALPYAFLLDPNVQLHQLILHAVVSMTSILTVLSYEKICISDPGLFAKYFNITLLGNIEGRLGEEEQVKTPWTKRLREYSIQDLIALWYPTLSILTLPVVMVTYTYDPSMKFLLYAALPSRLQNWTSFGLCLIEEARFLLILVATLVPIWQMQVISFDLIGIQHQRLIRKIQNGTCSRRSVYGLLRILQLYVSMLNNVNSYLIFVGKLLLISVSIIAGYAAVAHFNDHPMFGILYYVVVLDATSVYTAVYQKAFKVSQLFEETARNALLHMGGKRHGIFKRQISSIPRTGVKVGRFHQMERESVPIFIDFVLKNIVNMLVAYG